MQDLSLYPGEVAETDEAGRSPNGGRPRRGREQLSQRFTLIELLVVVAIIAILASLLIPSLNRARYKSQVVGCVSQMHQMSIGIMGYTADYNNFYPAAPLGRRDPASIAFVDETSGTGENSYDFRPAFREYFGAMLNDIMKCPLTEELWWAYEDNNKTNPRMYYYSNIDYYNLTIHTESKTPYAFYFNTIGDQPLSNSWDMTRPMRRPGDTFEPMRLPGREFNVLMSDFLFHNYWGGEYVATCHQGPTGGGFPAGNYVNFNWGYGFFRGYETTANFCGDDGSIKTYENVGHDSEPSGAMVNLRNGGAAYLVPADFER